MITKMAALLALSFLASPGFSQSALQGQAENIPFKVCEQSYFWTRPSEEIQAKKWAFPRYGKTVEEGRKIYAWNHYFFLYDGSASLDRDVRDLTGIWTADAVDVKQLCDIEEHRKVANSEQVAVRALLHEVKSIQRQGTVYTIRVEPKEKGFQMVDFPRLPGPNTNLTFIFVNPEGQEIDRVSENDWRTTRRISGNQ